MTERQAAIAREERRRAERAAAVERLARMDPGLRRRLQREFVAAARQARFISEVGR